MSGLFSSDAVGGGQQQLGPGTGTGTGAGASLTTLTPAETKADLLINTEKERSDRQRIEAIQRQLRLETSARSRGYGLRSLIGALGQGRSSLLGSG